MRRLHLIFAIVVVTAFLSAFLAERRRPLEPAGEEFAPPSAAPLEPLSLERGEHDVHGTVVDHLGQPAAGVAVQLRPRAPRPGAAEPFFFDSTDAAGAFELHRVPAGACELLLLAPNVPNAVSDLEVPLDGALALTLGEPFPELPPAPDIVRTTLEGLIAPPAALGPPGALEGYEVLLRPRDDEARWRGGLERRAATDAAGRFRFEGLAVANYNLRVLPPWAAGGSWPALAAADVPAGALAAPKDDEAGALRIELATGELVGRLVDPGGLPVEGALLRLRAVGDPAERSWPAASTDAEGRFLLSDVAAAPDGRVYVLQVHAGAANVETEVLVRPGERRTVTFAPLDTRP